MNIGSVIKSCNELRPNQYSDSRKVQWLSELDGKIYDEIILTHEGNEIITFVPYVLAEKTEPSPELLATELLAVDPYSELYIHYLLAQVDYYNAEWKRYNNTSAMHNVTYQNYANWYNRTHLSNKNNNPKNL